MKHTQSILPAATRADPFDDSAQARQRRMGLLLPGGVPNDAALTVLATVFAGLLYDDLCDHCTTYDLVTTVSREFTSAVHSGVEPRKLFLSLCLQYDKLQKPLPDAIWWIAGNDALICSFMPAFIRQFEASCQNEGRANSDA